MTRRLLFGYLGVTLFVLLALEVPLGIQNQRSERHDVELKVAHDASVIASLAEDAVKRSGRAQLPAVAKLAYSYARSTTARVIVVDASGVALIDTSRRVVGVESFATRPEIKAALLGDVSTGVRPSKTLHTTLLYVAAPVAASGVVSGAVRITYPLSAVDARILRYWLILAAIAVTVLVGSAVVGIVTARFATKPLRELQRVAAAVGEGDLDARAPEGAGPPEVRSLAAVFNATASKLARLLRSQGEFIADASHELRTPLTALRLRLENLEQQRHSDGTGDDRDLEAALREVERLSDMVDGLLALARADAEQTPASPLNAAEIVRDRVAHWQALAEELGVTLLAATPERLEARAAPGRLTQVIDNLVANALAASARNTTVTVSASRRDDWVELRVRDEGRGMTDAQRERAFDRFWRARNERMGSGLGLAIVRKLVEADHGHVELQPAPSGGTDALVRLPSA